MAAGVPDAVSMKCSSGDEAGSSRSAGIVKNSPYGLVPSAFSTCTTLLLLLGSASRKRYWPAGSVTPGNVTGPLNVKSVRLSRGCADTGAATRQTNTATAQAKPKTRLLSMIGPPYLCVDVPRQSIFDGGPAGVLKVAADSVAVADASTGSAVLSPSSVP